MIFLGLLASEYYITIKKSSKVIKLQQLKKFEGGHEKHNIICVEKTGMEIIAALLVEKNNSSLTFE